MFDIYRRTRFEPTAFYNNLLYRQSNFNFCVVDPRRSNGVWGRIRDNERLIDSNVYRNTGFRTFDEAVNAYRTQVDGLASGPSLIFIDGLPLTVARDNISISDVVFISYYSGSGAIPTNACNFLVGYTFYRNVSFVNVTINIFNAGIRSDRELRILGSSYSSDNVSLIGRWDHIINDSTITTRSRFAFESLGEGDSTIDIRNSILRGVVFLHVPPGSRPGTIIINVYATEFRYAALYTNEAVGVRVNSNFTLSSIIPTLQGANTEMMLHDGNSNNHSYSTFVDGMIDNPALLESFDKYLAFNQQGEVFSNSSNTTAFVEVVRDYNVKNTDSKIVVLNNKAEVIKVKLPSNPPPRSNYLIAKELANDNVVVTSEIPINGKKQLYMPANILSITVTLNESKTKWYILQTSQHLNIS